MSELGSALMAAGLTALPGLFCLWHVWRDTDWFFKNSQAAFWVSFLGRSGARWFYGALGFFFLFAATVVALRRL